MRRRSRSFTLVELLVVIAILAVLASIAVYGVLSAIESGRVTRAQQTIQSLRAAIDAFEQRYGQVPPGTLRAFGVAHNEVNAGIETLLLCLRSTRDGPALFDISAHGDSLANRDGDSSAEAYQLLQVEGHPDLFELVDPWGNPYVYIPAGVTPDGEPTFEQTYTYMTGSGEYITVQPALWAEFSTAGTMPRRYMLWSFGPNGINEHGFGDDIVSWEKSEEERSVQIDR